MLVRLILGLPKKRKIPAMSAGYHLFCCTCIRPGTDFYLLEATGTFTSYGTYAWVCNGSLWEKELRLCPVYVLTQKLKMRSG